MYHSILVLFVAIGLIECCHAANSTTVPRHRPISHTNLFSDASSLLSVVVHNYGYACLRKLAVKYPDDFVNISSVLHNHMKPVSAGSVLRFAEDNKKALLDLNATHPQEFSSDCSTSIRQLWDSSSTPSRWQSGHIVVAIDTLTDFTCHSDASSCFPASYSITVDRSRRRVIVTFIGSEVPGDWFQNIGGKFQSVRNPHCLTQNKQPKKFRLHDGFYNSLWKEPSNGERTNKFTRIQTEVTRVLAENNHFELWVTGHGLGGSLSTLFAFFISAQQDIPKPVSLISFASPLVGDNSWQKAFMMLEKNETLRHLRVTVREDFVPTVPYASPLLTQWGDYQHTGIRLNLYKNQTVSLQHSYKLPLRRGARNVTKKITDTLPWHELGMYDSRLRQALKALDGLTLPGLYEDANVCGAFSGFSWS